MAFPHLGWSSMAAYAAGLTGECRAFEPIPRVLPVRLKESQQATGGGASLPDAPQEFDPGHIRIATLERGRFFEDGPVRFVPE